MDMQGELREAIVQELRRQAEISEGRLTVEAGDEDIVVNGPVKIDDLVMVIAGSLAGGP
ncbi:hypothetical protein [Lutibaculum baratangense]|uniref:BON domain-containing protein n=1 Tax=Lutibaculum baratangense AMV1 TaxID=631454 RepID=V4R8R4_9HYPH|nr:hypothetical protein [Lutibaculum baratangense]ESR22566.1 hypothetical protein N177_3702 [Lutibaculum baratangense AMV1]